MISIAALDQSIASDGSPSLQAICDRLVSHVLDCAVFHGWGQRPDGTRAPLFRMTKAIPGLPAGKVVALSALHDALWPMVAGAR